MSGRPHQHPLGTRTFAATLQVTGNAHLADQTARIVLLMAGLSVFAVLGFIVWTLAVNTWLFFQEVSLLEFFTTTTWESATTVGRAEGKGGQYGVLPLLAGTFLVTVGASIIGLPIGLGTAIYLSEYASSRVRGILKPVLEVLAGVPSIVFGFFALEIISPILHEWTAPGTLLHLVFGRQTAVFSALAAIIVVGVMVLPIITSLSEDALRAVPNHLREASVGLGATKWETTRSVVVPAALSGITASFVLGVARAIGETMAVALAAGTQPVMTFNPADPVQTMTAFMVQRASGDVPQTGPDYWSLFAVGSTLFLITLSLNIVARRFVKKYRQAGEGQ